MFFKLYIPLVFILIFSACNKVGEKRYEAPNVKFEVCLSNVDQKVKKYFEGNLKNSEISSFFNCVDKTLNSFLDSYKEKEFNRYQPGELIEFVKENFYPKLDIPENFIYEFMKLKKSLFGGSVLSFSREEFVNIIDLLGLLKKHSIKLNPYIRIYSKSVNPESMNQSWLTLEAFNAALIALEESAEEVASKIGNNTDDYYFDDFEDLGRELREFLNWEKVL